MKMHCVHRERKLNTLSTNCGRRSGNYDIWGLVLWETKKMHGWTKTLKTRSLCRSGSCVGRSFPHKQPRWNGFPAHSWHAHIVVSWEHQCVTGSHYGKEITIDEKICLYQGSHSTKVHPTGVIRLNFCHYQQHHNKMFSHYDRIWPMRQGAHLHSYRGD